MLIEFFNNIAPPKQREKEHTLLENVTFVAFNLAPVPTIIREIALVIYLLMSMVFYSNRDETGKLIDGT